MSHNETLLLFGGVPTSYLKDWNITSDLTLAEEKLGVHFVEVTQDALMDRYKALDQDACAEAAYLAQNLVIGASAAQHSDMPPAPPLVEIEKATQLYVAMQHFVAVHEAQAVSIVCGPWHTEGNPTPCVALMLFQERGIPAACQGDIDALLTMMLFKRVAGLVSFMGGAMKVGEYLGISHCVLCRNLQSVDTALQPYWLSNYHGRKASPTVWTEVPSGMPVTIARLTQNLASLLLTTGTTLHPADDALRNAGRCRNTLIIQGPDREQVLQAVMGVQNHYVVAYGDHVQALTALAEEKGIHVVRL
jgi:L-fucose isomerase-like protein